MYLRNIYVGSSLGIGAITAHGFSVYPDPVATTGNIEFMQDLSGELNLRIMDLKGQVMKQTHTSVPAGFVHLSFDVSGWGNKQVNRPHLLHHLLHRRFDLLVMAG